MNVPIDTLAFAESFENAGFGHEARARAVAFAQAQDGTRERLLTTADLELRLSEFEARLNKQIGDMEVRLSRQASDGHAQLTRQIADNGKDISGRLWSTATIIAGVSTAISATIGAGVAPILKWGGI